MKKRLIKSAQTRLRIFDAALSLLDSHEIDDVTIRMIVEKANVSIGTFYNYYNTKVEVYSDAHRFMNIYFEDTVAKNLPSTGVWNQLIYFFDQYYYYNVKMTPRRLLLALNRNYTDLPTYRQSTYGVQHVLISIISEAQENGEITREESAKEIALFLLNAMRSYYRHWILSDDKEYDIRKVANRSIRKLLSLYVTPPTDERSP